MLEGTATWGWRRGCPLADPRQASLSEPVCFALLLSQSLFRYTLKQQIKRLILFKGSHALTNPQRIIAQLSGSVFQLLLACCFGFAAQKFTVCGNNSQSKAVKPTSKQHQAAVLNLLLAIPHTSSWLMCITVLSFQHVCVQSLLPKCVVCTLEVYQKCLQSWFFLNILNPKALHTPLPAHSLLLHCLFWHTVMSLTTTATCGSVE